MPVSADRRLLIVNADDLGAADGINCGILEGHRKGVVTSASLMVTGRAVGAAVALSERSPDLAIGLHFDVCGEDERDFDLERPGAVGEEFRRQLEVFYKLLGRLPTHVDSHRHVHRVPGAWEQVLEVVEPIGVPVRGDGRVNMIGGFYAQWEWGVTNLEHVSLRFLRQLLRDEVQEGWNEISCHPGYVSDGYRSVYGREREHELRTLTDPAVGTTLRALGIRLLSYADYQSPRLPGKEVRA